MPPKWYPKVLRVTVAGWVAPVTSVALARSVYDPGPGVRQRNSHRCEQAPERGAIAGDRVDRVEPLRGPGRSVSDRQLTDAAPI